MLGTGISNRVVAQAWGANDMSIKAITFHALILSIPTPEQEQREPCLPVLGEGSQL